MAPYKKITKKEYKLMTKPWITNEILEKCNKRDSILKDISKENDTDKISSLRNGYKKLRNETTNLSLISTQKNLLHIPRIKTVTYGNKSIKFHCAKLWNDTFKKGIAIDNKIKNNVGLDKILNNQHLKRTLKKHYLYSYSLE